MTKAFSLPLPALLALALSASACTTMTPAGLIAASRLDPLNTPPSEIAVAVGVPETLRLADGDAEFRMAFRGGSAASTILLEEVAELRLAPAGQAEPQPNATDETVYVARIAPEDTARIAALQAEIRTLREAGTDGAGTLNIRVVGGCYVGAAPASIMVSTWLQTAPADGFVPLTRRQGMVRALGARDAAMLLAELTPCDADD